MKVRRSSQTETFSLISKRSSSRSTNGIFLKRSRSGISRQGVSDLVRRTEEQLYAYERKLHMAEKFRAEQRIARELLRLSEAESGEALLPEIRKLANELMQLTAR